MHIARGKTIIDIPEVPPWSNALLQYVPNCGPINLLCAEATVLEREYGRVRSDHTKTGRVDCVNVSY